MGFRPHPPLLMFKINGVSIRNRDKPPLIVQYSGRLIILGTARCLWDDLKSLDQNIKSHVMAVNLAGYFYTKPIDHWASLHPVFLQRFHDIRAAEYTKHSHIHRHSIKYGKGMIGWDFGTDSGTSSLFAVRVALCLGYEEIILAGIPLDNTGSFYLDPHSETPGHLKYGDDHVFNTWKQAVRNNSEMKKRVRSCSGKTKAIFGEPIWQAKQMSQTQA